MIAHDLKCHRRHTFEAWFKNLGTFERQKKGGLIECPVCGSTRIGMVYRARAIRKNVSPDPPAGAGSSIARRVERFLNENFENVGRHFAEEARKVHYGEAEERNIRGEATAEEESDLAAEGIRFYKIAAPKASH